MTIFVAGGAGFIGSNFIYYLLKKYPTYRVVCLDKLTSAANPSTLDAAISNYNFRFVKVDICDREKVFSVFKEEKPDIVVNFAAESNVDHSIENPEIFLKTNVLGTAVLMDACLEYKTGRFHQISTDEVYGDSGRNFKKISFKEESPLNPGNPYSASKAAADMLLMSYINTYGLSATISRSTNNYGPYQSIDKFIPLAITNIISGKKVPLYGKGINVRDWLYVNDHCEAIDLIVHKGKPGEIYNIGVGNELKNIDVANMLCDILKVRDFVTFVEDRKGHDMCYSIDSSKIKKLGWVAKANFKNEIVNTVKWYENYQNWWKKENSYED